MNILITGCCGFIGFHLVKKLLNKKNKVFGIDNLSSISKWTQKKRVKKLKSLGFNFINKDLIKKGSLNKLNNSKIDVIIHLAAQPGVRASQVKPNKTLDNNIIAYLNVLEFAKRKKINKILYASSSSVYGDSKNFIENEKLFRTNSIYASTKLYNEILSYTYHSLYKINFISMRFFSVYGPYGREDMAYFKFIKDIIDKGEITVYGDTNSVRSYTFIDDVIESIILLLKYKKKNTFFEIFNIGNNKSFKLSKMIKFYKNFLKLDFKIKILKRNDSDMKKTLSNNLKFQRVFNKTNNTSLEDGLKKFCAWFISKQ